MNRNINPLNQIPLTLPVLAHIPALRSPSNRSPIVRICKRRYFLLQVSDSYQPADRAFQVADLPRIHLARLDLHNHRLRLLIALGVFIKVVDDAVDADPLASQLMRRGDGRAPDWDVDWSFPQAR